MCVDPVTASLIAAGVSAAATVAGGAAEQSAANANARALQKQGRQEYAAANAEANNMRVAADAKSGAVIAQQAANGVDIGGGSAADVGAKDAQNMELDALRALYGGQVKQWGLNEQAKLQKYAGKQALAKSIIGAASQVAGSALKAIPTGGPAAASMTTASGGGSGSGFSSVAGYRSTPFIGPQ